MFLTDELKYANSTANQRLSLIRGLLEYAADLDDSVMPLYLSAKKIRKLTVPDKPIEYFSEQQIESMINAPDRKKKIGRRNCLILTIEYDCALRIHEVTLLQLRDKSLNTTSGFYAFATLKTLRHSLEKADKVREENKNKNWKKTGIREKLEEISK